MDTLRDEIRKPVDEIEEKEAAELKARQDRLAEIKNLPNIIPFYEFSKPSDACRIALEKAKQLIEFDNWGDFEFAAKTAFEEVSDFLNKKIVDCEKSEADAAELAQLKKEKAERDQKDREDQIAREAAEKAKRDEEENLRRAEAAKKAAEDRAIEAERLRKEQEQQAEERRIAAEKKAKEDAEKAVAAALEAERKRVAEEAEKKRIAEEKLAANKRHRTKINNEIISYLKAIIDNETNLQHQAEAVVEAIAKGEVPHVEINY
jgi:hypothetical protein